MKTINPRCKDCDGEWDLEYYTVLFCPLHAAAPEMLGALRDIAFIVKGPSIDEFGIVNIARIARAAIEKAEGRNE